jgi:hypothetical protein
LLYYKKAFWVSGQMKLSWFPQRFGCRGLVRFIFLLPEKHRQKFFA